MGARTTALATHTGPFNVSSFAPDIRDRGAECSVFRSDDGGESRQVLEGLPVASAAMVCGLSIDPSGPNTVFVGYTDGATFDSKDAGRNWSELAITQDKLYGVPVLRSRIESR